MHGDATTAVLLLLITFVGLGGVCWLGMRLLVPTLEKTPQAQATNYAGRHVFYGLGIVWLLWGCGWYLVTGVLGEGDTATISDLTPLMPAVVLPLVLGAFAFGFIDDVYGSADARGFKGHLTALFQGRLTTGGLKLFGISALSLVAAYALSAQRGADGHPATAVGFALLGGAAIALTANFHNLTDLRPGRVSKVYLVLVLVGVLLGIWLPRLGYRAWLPSPFGGFAPLYDGFVLLLPLCFVLRLDLGERGMQGDAGANAMGVLVGFFLVERLMFSWVGLGIYVVLMLALNLASEKVSFSRVIAGNKVLTWIDNLGRLDTEK